MYSLVAEVVPCTTYLVTNVCYTAILATNRLMDQLRGSVKLMGPGLEKNRVAKVTGGLL